MVVINFNFDLFFRYLFKQYGSASIIKICITGSISVSKKSNIIGYLFTYLFIYLFNFSFIYLFMYLLS